jgi:hypothetical protein
MAQTKTQFLATQHFRLMLLQQEQTLLATQLLQTIQAQSMVTQIQMQLRTSLHLIHGTVTAT